MNERIKELRLALKLTQDDFGAKIGSARNTIANYENGNRNPSNAVIMAICREFDVNDEWLRTGKGEMRNELLPEDEYSAAAAELSKDGDKIAMQAVIEYWKLDKDSKKLFREFLLHIVENAKNKE